LTGFRELAKEEGGWELELDIPGKWAQGENMLDRCCFSKARHTMFGQKFASTSDSPPPSIFTHHHQNYYCERKTRSHWMKNSSK